jgi:hypothetical protein
VAEPFWRALNEGRAGFQRDDFAVDDGFVGHRGQRLDYRGVFRVEILVVARAEMDSAAVLDRQRPKAIELQLV